MTTHYPLSWWIERIKTPLSLARFGDGEFLCMEGKQGGNSHGCSYTPELREALIETAQDSRITKGLQRILPSQHKRVREYLDGWVDSEILADSLAVGELKPFFDELKTQNLIIVSSKTPFPELPFIQTPRTNSFEERERIVKECRGYSGIFLFACGMAAGVFVHDLHDGVNSYIDIGHLLDPLCGELSRDYMKDNELIYKNYD